MLRIVTAPNPSAMTLDGTHTFVLGAARVAIIDPGPAIAAHLAAVTAATTGAAATIVLTHDHPDHAAAADTLAARLDARVLAAARGTLSDGDVIDTDAGVLEAYATPGHTPDHFAFHWPREGAVFCGDLMMGGLDTALVAAPDGDLDDYLESLAVLRALEPRIIHPAHGPAFPDPAAALARYGAHRSERERQVLDALRAGPRAADELADAVYGHVLPPELRRFTAATVEAYLNRLERRGAVQRSGSAWERVA